MTTRFDDEDDERGGPTTSWSLCCGPLRSAISRFRQVSTPPCVGVPGGADSSVQPAAPRSPQRRAGDRPALAQRRRIPRPDPAATSPRPGPLAHLTPNPDPTPGLTLRQNSPGPEDVGPQTVRRVGRSPVERPVTIGDNTKGLWLGGAHTARYESRPDALVPTPTPTPTLARRFGVAVLRSGRCVGRRRPRARGCAGSGVSSGRRART